jgi:hypothetical protein
MTTKGPTTTMHQSSLMLSLSLFRWYLLSKLSFLLWCKKYICLKLCNQELKMLRIVPTNQEHATTVPMISSTKRGLDFIRDILVLCERNRSIETS